MLQRSEKIRQAILQAVAEHPGENPTSALQKQFSVSREAIRKHLKALIESHHLREEGYGKGRRYYPGQNFIWKETSQSIDLSYKELKKAGEAEIFQKKILPFLQTNRFSESNIKRVAYAATEILNNVIDHSQSHHVAISLKLNQSEFTLVVSDDGLGVFETLQTYFSLDDYYEAAGELAKGKRTTDPARHAGEGLFFSARIADAFSVEANGIKYSYVEENDDWAIGPSEQTQGSKLTLKFDTNSTKTTKEVFEKYTEDFDFQQKSPRLVSPYIIKLPKGAFPSRSEAKKILAGAEQFSSIVVDFKDVESIGQGFADEMFRVFQNSHPQITIETRNANSFVERMIKHVKK